MSDKLFSYPKPPQTLEFVRSKKRWIFASILYRINRFSNFFFGKLPTIKFLLNLEWIIWRLAYENSYNYYGQEFPNKVYGINEKLIREYSSSNCTVIDIGCGSGRLSYMASKTASQVLGIDYDPGSIEFAKKYNNNSNIQYVCGSVLDMNIDSKFDLAIMSGVLEHLDSAQEYLNYLHKVAKRIIIEVPDIEADQLNLIRHNLATRIYTDNDHIREYTFDALMEQLNIANWSVIYYGRRGRIMTVVADEG